MQKYGYILNTAQRFGIICYLCILNGNVYRELKFHINKLNE